MEIILSHLIVDYEIQTCRPDSAAIPDTWQDKAAESVHEDSSAEARSQW